MLFSAIYGRITDYSQDETSTATTRAKAAANDALLRIAGEKSWDILKRSGNVSFTATRTYTLTDTYSDLNYVTRVWYVSNGQRVYIELVDDDEFEDYEDTSSTGTPEVCRNTYVSGAHKLELNITPSANFRSLYSTMYIEYQEIPATLTNDGDVPEIPYPNQHMAIVYFGLADVSAHQGDRSAIPFWESRAFKALTHAFKRDIKKKGRKLKTAKPTMGIYGTVGRSWSQQKGDDYNK